MGFQDEMLTPIKPEKEETRVFTELDGILAADKCRTVFITR